MYKLLLFLKDTTDGETLNHFEEKTIDLLSGINNTDPKVGNVESSLLLAEKYIKFCELEFLSKDDFDVKMNSKAGREFAKDLMQFHEFVTVIHLNYPD